MGTRERRARSNESDRVLAALFLAAHERLHNGERVEIAGITPEISGENRYHYTAFEREPANFVFDEF